MRNEHLYSLRALPCSLFPPVSAGRSRRRGSPRGSPVTAGSGAAPGLSITRQSTFSAHLTCQLGDGALLFTLFTFYRQSCDPGLLFKAYPSRTSPPLSAAQRRVGRSHRAASARAGRGTRTRGDPARQHRVRTPVSPSGAECTPAPRSAKPR